MTRVHHSRPSFRIRNATVWIDNRCGLPLKIELNAGTFRAAAVFFTAEQASEFVALIERRLPLGRRDRIRRNSK